MPKKGVCLGMLAGGNSKIFGLGFIPKIGEMESNLTDSYFSNGLVQPPTSFVTLRSKIDKGSI